MTWWQNRSLWLVPTAISTLTVVVGVAINLATDLKHSIVAWLAVATLTVLIASLSGVQAKRNGTPAIGTTVESVPPKVNSRANSELMLRRTEHTASDGSKTTTVDIYSKDVAIRILKEDLLGGEAE